MPRRTRFHAALPDLGTIHDEQHTRVNLNRESNRYPANVEFLTDCAVELHRAGRDLNDTFKADKFVDSMADGRFYCHTDNITGFMHRCDHFGVESLLPRPFAPAQSLCAVAPGY